MRKFLNEPERKYNLGLSNFFDLVKSFPSVGGSMVEISPATGVTGVRLPTNARHYIFPNAF